MELSFAVAGLTYYSSTCVLSAVLSGFILNHLRLSFSNGSSTIVMRTIKQHIDLITTGYWHASGFWLEL